LLLWRAVFAFVALPGVVAFAIPLTLAYSPLPSPQLRPLGLLFLAPGTFLLIWCVYKFYASGRGTLAPWAPPQHLVVDGPYRVSRNPMYVGVALILVGWASLFWSLVLAAYAAIVLLAFHLRVIAGEEPWLARTFGADWDAYRSRVPRWLF
jgi:protein-S-isoprenylcysteine O-methyltransferase Ste14